MTSLDDLRKKLLERKKEDVAQPKISTDNSATTQDRLHSPVQKMEEKVTSTTPINTQTSSTAMGTSPEYKQVIDRILRLENQIRNRIPGYADLLHTIHRQLSKNTELTHLLKPEEIGIIVEAMCLRKDVVIQAELAKKISKKKLGETTADDLL